MSADTRYPHIPLNEGERRRETELLKLAQAFANEMRRQGITYAMKGGTALRFTLGLPRPSMDLDFEGERPMWLRRAVKRAARKAFPGERYRVGYDLTREGTIPVRPPRKRGDDPGLGVDYRESGSMKGIPERIPLQACTFYKGVVVYNADELPHRKLQTLIGEEPREKARDIYDAGWLVTERPELIREDDREKLERWLAAKSPADIELLKERVRDDAITGRADAENIWKLLAEGIGRLKEYDRSGGPRADRIPGDAGGGGGRGPTRWAMAKHDSPMRLAEEQDDATPDRAPRAKLPGRSERKGPYRE